MNARRHPLISAARVTSLGTLASRVLGMVRDMSMAALLGLVGGGVMDAFVIAYRIPNLFRRLFGEGALTASYLPVLSAELERDRPGAWRLASVIFTCLAIILAGVVLLGEGLFALAWLALGRRAGRDSVGLAGRRDVALSAVDLPGRAAYRHAARAGALQRPGADARGAERLLAGGHLAGVPALRRQPDAGDA